jgi:hypothetical protein
MMTMTFFNVAGGVSGVPDELQIVPEAKGGPPLLEPLPLPPLPEPLLLPPLLEPLPLPPLPEPLLLPPLLDPPLLLPPLLDPPLLLPPLLLPPLLEPLPLPLGLPPSSLVPELGPLDPHAQIAETQTEARSRDVRRFIGIPFFSAESRVTFYEPGAREGSLFGAENSVVYSGRPSAVPRNRRCLVDSRVTAGHADLRLTRARGASLRGARAHRARSGSRAR